jgi:hypothetical protein
MVAGLRVSNRAARYSISTRNCKMKEKTREEDGERIDFLARMDERNAASVGPSCSHPLSKTARVCLLFPLLDFLLFSSAYTC